MGIVTSGVYQITFKNSEKRYIGSAIKLSNRKKAHISQLRNNKHPNKHLQNAFNKYGEDNYIFKPLLICDASNCLLYEQMVLDFFTPEKLYNKRIIAESNYGIKYPEEVKEKLRSAVHKRKDSLSKKLTDIWDERRSTGNMNVPEETKINMRHPNSKPKTFTPESRKLTNKKLSLATKAFWERITPEEKQRINEKRKSTIKANNELKKATKGDSV